LTSSLVSPTNRMCVEILTLTMVNVFESGLSIFWMDKDHFV
jgi:hypothetical protein